MNNQFNSRNQYELAQIIVDFRELSALHDKQFTLYLDVDYWEIFDMRFGKTIIRHEYKHIRKLHEDILHLTNSIMHVGCIKFRPNKQPNTNQSWALKFLKTLYNDDELKYFL